MLQPGGGPLQGLHPRRGAPAHGRRLERAAEADRGASAPPRLRLLHDRSLQGAADGALALPDVRLRAPAAAGARALCCGGSPTARASRLPDQALALVARGARGSFRDAVSTLDQLASATENDITRAVGAAAARRRRGGSALPALRPHRRPRHGRGADVPRGARGAGAGPRPARVDLLEHLRHLMLVQHMGEVPETLPVTEETRERLRAQANQLGEATVDPARRSARGCGRGHAPGRRPPAAARARAGQGHASRR